MYNFIPWNTKGESLNALVVFSMPLQLMGIGAFKLQKDIKVSYKSFKFMQEGTNHCE